MAVRQDTREAFEFWFQLSQYVAKPLKLDYVITLENAWRHAIPTWVNHVATHQLVYASEADAEKSYSLALKYLKSKNATRVSDLTAEKAAEGDVLEAIKFMMLLLNELRIELPEIIDKVVDHLERRNLGDPFIRVFKILDNEPSMDDAVWWLSETQEHSGFFVSPVTPVKSNEETFMCITPRQVPSNENFRLSNTSSAFRHMSARRAGMAAGSASRPPGNSALRSPLREAINSPKFREQRMRKQLDAKKEEFSKLQKEYLESEDRRSELQDLLREERANSRDLKLEKNHLRERVLDLESALKRFAGIEVELQHTMKSEEQLRESVADCKNEMKKLTRQREEAENDTQQAMRAKDDAEQRCRNLKLKLSDVNQELEIVNKKNMELKKAQTNLEMAVQALTSDLEEAQNTNKGLRQEFNTYKENNEKELFELMTSRPLGDEIQSLEAEGERIRQLEENLQKHQAEAEKLSAKLEVTTQKLLNESEKRKSGERILLAKLEEERSKSDIKVESYEASLQAEKDYVDELKAQCNSLRDKSAEANDVISKMQIRHTEELGKERKENDRLNTALTGSSEENSKLQVQKSELTNRVDELTSELEKLQKLREEEQKSWSVEKANLEESLTEWKAGAKREEDALQVYKTRFFESTKAHSAEMRQLEMQLMDWAAKMERLEVLENDICNLRNTITKQAAELENAQDELVAVENQLLVSDTAKNGLVLRVQDLQAALDERSNNVQHMENDDTIMQANTDDIQDQLSVTGLAADDITADVKKPTVYFDNEDMEPSFMEQKWMDHTSTSVVAEQTKCSEVVENLERTIRDTAHIAPAQSGADRGDTSSTSYFDFNATLASVKDENQPVVFETQPVAFEEQLAALYKYLCEATGCFLVASNPAACVNGRNNMDPLKKHLERDHSVDVNRDRVKILQERNKQLPAALRCSYAVELSNYPSPSGSEANVRQLSFAQMLDSQDETEEGRKENSEQVKSSGTLSKKTLKGFMKRLGGMEAKEEKTDKKLPKPMSNQNKET